MERASAESKSGWFDEKQYIGGGDFDDKSIDDVSDGNGSVSGSNHGPGISVRGRLEKRGVKNDHFMHIGISICIVSRSYEDER